MSTLTDRLDRAIDELRADQARDDAAQATRDAAAKAEATRRASPAGQTDAERRAFLRGKR
jgi:hypothetical protein